MYVPRPHQMNDAVIRSFVADVGAAEFVTVDRDGLPRATFLPIIWEGERVIAHFARANPHWKEIADGAPALLVIRGAHAYVSPDWYPTKRDHGKVVPTWNYAAVQLRGPASVFHDAERLREAVTTLTATHEGRRDTPWKVDDAPTDFIASMLRGIVGVEVAVESVAAKAKLSQNRPLEDRRGVIEGLWTTDDHRGEHRVAETMEHLLPSKG